LKGEFAPALLCEEASRGAQPSHVKEPVGVVDDLWLIAKEECDKQQ